MSYNLTPTITITADPVSHYRFDNLTDPVGTKITSAIDHTGRKTLTQTDPVKQPVVVGPSNPMISGITAAYFEGNQMLFGALDPIDQLDQTKEYFTVLVYENHYNVNTDPINEEGTMFTYGVSSAPGNQGCNLISTSSWYPRVSFRVGNGNPTLNHLSQTYDSGHPHPRVAWFKAGQQNTTTECWLNSEVRPVSANNAACHIHTNGATQYVLGDFNNIWIGNMDHPGSTSYDQGYRGRIYEVLLFDSDVTDPDIEKIHDYLRDKYRFDGSYLTSGEKCNVYGPNAHSKISNEDAFGMSNGENVNGKYPYDSQTLEYWVQFEGIGGDRNTYRHTGGHYWNPILEGDVSSMVNASNRNYYHRHQLNLRPQTGIVYMYSSNTNNGYITFYNKQWYHVRIVRDGINDASWRSRVWINGFYKGTGTQVNYRNVNGHTTQFGDAPDRLSWPLHDFAGVNNLPSAELPTMRIAGYRVVNEALVEENSYETTYGTLTSTGFAKPSDRAVATTTTPRKTPAERGATIDMTIQTAGASKPALLGKYEVTTPRWGSIHTYTNKLIRDLDHIIHVPGSEKTFKDTEINLTGNRLIDLTGLRNLYSVADGPGNDIPTAAKTVHLSNNQLTGFDTIDNSPFLTNLHAHYFHITQNPLTTLDGLGSAKSIRYLRAEGSYSLASIDDLHRAQWTTYDTQINVGNNSISSVNTKALTGMGSSASGTLTMTMHPLTSFNNLESNLRYYNLSDGRALIHDISTGPCPTTTYINFRNNRFQNTSIPANAASLWPVCTDWYSGYTNLDDISALSLIKGKPWPIGGIDYEELHTVTNLPLCAYAGFYALESHYHDDIHTRTLTDHGSPTATDRQDGFTAKYGTGERIYMYGKLNLAFAPLTDIRIFEDSYHGFDYTNSYNNGRHDIHQANLIGTNIPNTANGLGVIKNWSNLCELNIGYNDFTSIDAMFADTGFVDPAWDRAYFQLKKTYKRLYLQHCPNLTDLTWMLKANFAGVEQLYLEYSGIDYSHVDAIKTSLIALKANGDILLQSIIMTGTVWDDGHKGQSIGEWNNSNYYNFDGIYYGTSNLFSDYNRADGYMGFGDNPSPQQLLRTELYDAGINLYFSNPGTTNPNYLGYGQDPRGTQNHVGVYPNPYLDNFDYRWGRLDVTGRLVWSETDGSTANASNTLTLDFSISYPMFADGYMLLKGIYGAGTATNASLPLAGTAASIFGSTGEWDQTAGTLKLTVATGQTLTHDVVRSISFTLINPPDNSSPANSTYGRLVYIDAFDHHGNERATNHNLNSSAAGYVMDITP